MNANQIDKQELISRQFPLMADSTMQSTSVASISGETVQFIVASTNANDVGSAAGTTVYARLAHGAITDSMRGRMANANDTSFSFGTGTCLTTEVQLDWNSLERKTVEFKTRAEKLAAITANFTNGQFAIDYHAGIIIGKKATTAATDTASYAYRSASTVSSTGETVVTLGSLISGEDQTNFVMQVVDKPIAANTYSPTEDVSAAAEASSVSKASAGNLLYAWGINTSGSTRYWQGFDSATLPADGAIPKISKACATLQDFEFNPGKYGSPFANGFCWCWSSTAGTKTIGSTDGIATVQYK